MDQVLRNRDGLDDSNGWTDVEPREERAEDFVHVGATSNAAEQPKTDEVPPRPPPPNRASKLSAPRLSHPPPAYVATPKAKTVAAHASSATAGAPAQTPKPAALSSSYPSSVAATTTTRSKPPSTNYSRSNVGGGGGAGGADSDNDSNSTVGGSAAVQKTGWAFLDNLLEEFAKVPQQSTADHEAPFEARVLIANAERFMEAFAPFADAIDMVESVMHWEEPRLTATLFVLYVWFVLYSWVLPGILLVALIALGWAYAIRAGMVDVDAANDEEDEHNGGDESNSTSGDRPASPTSPKRKSGFSKFFSGWSEKYTRARQQGQKVQNKFALYSQRAEKIVLLLDWSTPANTKVVVYVLAAAVVVTAVMPTWMLGPLLQAWFGFSFFIKAYVYHKYPALKARYDSSFNFWCGLPDKTTVDYAVAAPPGSAGVGAGAGAGAGGEATGRSNVAQPYSTTARPGSLAATAAPLARANSGAAAVGRASSLTAPASPPRTGASNGGGGRGADSVADDSIGSWSCVYLNDKVTASKAGRLVLSSTHVYFKTRDEGTSLFNVPLDQLIAVMPGDVLKAAQEGKSKSKSSWLSSTLAKVGGKLGEKLGIGSLVLKVSENDAVAAGSHTFTTMPKRDEAGNAIGNAAPEAVEYHQPSPKP